MTEPYTTHYFPTMLNPAHRERLQRLVDELPGDNPVIYNVNILLNAEWWVSQNGCTRCGAVVGDEVAHDAWHDWVDQHVRD